MTTPGPLRLPAEPETDPGPEYWYLTPRLLLQELTPDPAGQRRWASQNSAGDQPGQGSAAELRLLADLILEVIPDPYAPETALDPEDDGPPEY